MKMMAWTTVDKSSWPDGPWRGEPDKIQWTDNATGLACLIKRNGAGALCGYVGVPEGHPWYGKDYDAVPAEVHGELTYANHCQEGDEAETICHVPAPGEPDNVWWVGFDCAHLGDFCPAYERSYSLARARRGAAAGEARGVGGSTYKPVAYVQAECASLARQVQEAGR